MAENDETTESKAKKGKADPETVERLKRLVKTIQETKSKAPADFYTVCEALRDLTADLAWREVFPEVELDEFCKKRLGCSAGWARKQAVIAERIDRKSVLKIGISRTRVVAMMREGAQRNRALALAMSGHSGFAIQDKILNRSPAVRQYLKVLHAAFLLDRDDRKRLVADLELHSRQETISTEQKKKAVHEAMEALST